jgi:hypothetical protein
MLVTTGSRQEKSTVVTGRSARAVGLVPGVGVTLGAGLAAVVDGERLGLELTLEADGDGLHATSKKARIASVRFIVAALTDGTTIVLRETDRGTRRSPGSQPCRARRAHFRAPSRW